MKIEIVKRSIQDVRIPRRKKQCEEWKGHCSQCVYNLSSEFIENDEVLECWEFSTEQFKKYAKKFPRKTTPKELKKIFKSISVSYFKSLNGDKNENNI
jgi:hypothetical protein